MIENDEFTIHRGSREEAEEKCSECGAEIRGGLRYCTSCGAPVSEDGHPPLREVSRQENEDSRPLREPGRRVRSNADKAERSYREFNAVARPRRRKNERRSRLPVILLLFVLAAALGGGVYSFMKQSEDMPWDSSVISKPEKPAPSAGTDPVPGQDQPVTAGRTVTGTPVSAGRTVTGTPVSAEEGAHTAVTAVMSQTAADISNITGPTRGIVIGSSVNLRGSHTIKSPVLGKVSVGNRVEVTDSWLSDDGAEAVALSDIQASSEGGKKIRILKGKGVTVSEGPDASGMMRVTLPEDKNKTVYMVSAKSLSDPQAWPWYKVKPQKGKEGWIFGKFLTVIDPRDETLSPAFLDTALASFGTTKEQAEALLGKPAKSSSRKVKTQGGVETETTLAFSGLTLVLHDGPGGSGVRRALITSAARHVEGGLAVGMERRNVLSILGLPNDVDRGDEVYRANRNSGIRIKYDNYRVKSIALGELK